MSFSNEIVGTRGQGVAVKGKWLGATYAIKGILATTVEDYAIKEIQILGKVHHANIVSIMGVCHKPPLFHIVMEYFHSISLEDALFTPTTRIYFTPDDKHSIAYQCSSAILYLHKENTEKPIVVYSDIKPSNILISQDLINGERVMKLCDFGLAKFKGSNTSMTSAQGSAGGTTGYIAPEIMVGGKKATVKSDVWSFGITIHELYTNKHMWTKYNFIFIFDKLRRQPNFTFDLIPKFLRSVLIQALSYDPANRSLIEAFVEAYNERHTFQETGGEDLQDKDDTEKIDLTKIQD